MRIWELFRTALKSNENGPLRKSVALSVYLAVGSISPCCAADVSFAVLEAMIWFSGSALLRWILDGPVLVVGVVRCGRQKDPNSDPQRAESGLGFYTLAFFRWSVDGLSRPLIGLFSLQHEAVVCRGTTNEAIRSVPSNILPVDRETRVQIRRRPRRLGSTTKGGFNIRYPRLLGGGQASVGAGLQHQHRRTNATKNRSTTNSKS
jgi:hypothetical protein